MKETLIFGHKNPDTDSILSAIIVANLETKMQNPNVKACSLGKPNKETEFILNYFNVAAPEVIDDVSSDDTVILVDHNNFKESATSIKEAKILKVIDHHCISGFEVAYPIEYTSRPYGCTATLLYSLYNLNKVEIDKTIAGLMLSCIISDTLLFNSPTCTPKDKEAAEALAKIANVDINSYGLEMLKAGTDLSSFSSEELINLDAKEGELNGKKFIVAQVNTVSIDDVLKNQADLESEIKKVISDRNLDLFLFAITDIMNCNSKAIVLGNCASNVEKAYNVKLENNVVFLKGVVSRKKQIIPVLGENL